MKTQPLIGGWKLFWLLAVVVLALSAAILTIHPDRVGATRVVIRVTAYTSFVPFLAAFLATPLAMLAPNGFTRGLLRERRYLGLSFAFSHLVHFAAIVAYGTLNPEFWPSRSVLTNAPGTIGYLFIALLAATSFRYFARRMNATAWKRLHTIGVWVIAIVFGLSFLKRIPTVSTLYAIPFSIFCVAVVVRLIGKRLQDRKRKRAQTRGTRKTTFPPPKALESLS